MMGCACGKAEIHSGTDFNGGSIGRRPLGKPRRRRVNKERGCG